MKKNNKQWLLAVMATLAVGCAGVGMNGLTSVAAENVSATNYVTAGENVTLKAAGKLDDSLVGAVTTYVQKYTKGLKASSSTMSGTVMSNAIDLEKVGDDPLIRFFPADMEISAVEVRIIDASNTSNVVAINYMPSRLYTHDKGQMYLGVDTTITFQTATGYVTTDAKYEYGQVLGNWWPLAWGEGFEGGMSADLGDGRGDRWVTSASFDRFSVAYDSGAFVTTRDTKVLENWTGFGGSNVYVQLSWKSKEANSGLLIDTLAGIDFTTETVDGGNSISTTKSAIPESPIPTTAGYSVQVISKDVMGNESDITSTLGSSWANRVGEIGAYVDIANEANTLLPTLDLGNYELNKDLSKLNGIISVKGDLVLKIVYSQIVKGIEVTEALNAGSNVSMVGKSGLNKGLPGGVTTYAQNWDWVSAIRANSSTLEGKVTTHTIDLNAVGSANLLRVFPADMNVQTITFKIVDVENSENYILVNYTPSTAMTYENDVGKMSLGSNMTITYKTANGYVTTGNVYEYGLVLDTWWPFAWIAGSQGGFGGNIMGDAIIWIDGSKFERFAVALDGNQLITSRTVTELVDWVGFASGNVKVEATWTSDVENSGLMIDMVAGLDTTEDKAREIVTVYGAEIKEVYVGDACDVPTAKAWSYVSGAYTISKTKIYVNVDGEWIDKSSLLNGNTFTPDKAGEWKYVFIASDDGQTKIERPFTVKIKEFAVNEIKYESVYFVGENWTLIAPNVTNMKDSEYTFSCTLTKDGATVALDALGTLTDVQLGMYTLTYTANSIYGATFTESISFEVAKLPVWQENYTIQAGQGIGDIEYPELRDEWSISVLVYAAGDANKVPVAPVNMAEGVYVMEIEMIVEGREENVKTTAILTVEKGQSSNSGNENSSASDNNNASVGGCSASVSLMGLSALVALAGAVVLKKKEN